MSRFFILKLSLAFSLLALAAMPSAAASEGINTGWGDWQWVNPLVQGNMVEAITFIDANTGWAVGAGGLIMKTTDGGNSWISQTPASSCGASPGSSCNLHGVSFADANNGWAVGEYGTVWRTTNGGASWSRQAFPSASVSLTAVSFAPNTGAGVAVGDGYVYYTSNGGATWSQASGISPSHWLSSVQMINASSGYAGGTAGSIYKTGNGGASWGLQTSPSTADGLTAVFFVDVNRGFAVGNCSDSVYSSCPGGTASSGILWRTTNGGSSWEKTSINAIDKLLYGVAVAGEGNNALVVVGDGGTILRRDYSTIWTDTVDQVAANLSMLSSGVTSGRLLAVDFATSSAGYAAGEAGVVTRTGDAGSSWSLKAGGESKNIAGSSFINDTTGWMVGYDGLVLKTANGGATWSSDSSGIPADADLEDVQFLSATTGFAAGCRGGASCRDNGTGVVYKYNSGVWSAMNTPDLAGKPLKSVHMSDATHGWAVGSGGTLLKTSDGSNWTSANSGIPGNVILNAVDSTGSADGWVVGEVDNPDPNSNGPGVLYRYSGSSWSEATPASPPSFLTSIDMVNSSTGYAVGSGGKVYKTTNGGVSWAAQNSGTGKLLSAVSFKDAYVGMAVGEDGRIIKTTNGGANWWIEQGGTNISINTVSVTASWTDPFVAYVGGGNSMVLKYSQAPPYLTWYDYGGANTGLFLFWRTGTGYAPAPVWSSGPGGWEWSRSKTTATDQNGDGNAELVVLYNYGNANTGVYFFDPAAGYAPIRTWLSGPGGWEWSRSRVVTAADQLGAGIAELAVLYDYGSDNTGLWLVDPSAGPGPQDRKWLSGPGHWNWSRSVKLIRANFDDDPETELAVFYDYGGATSGIWLFDPPAWDNPQRVWLSGAGGWEVSRTKMTVGDQNNDGKAEIIALYDYGNANTGLWVFDPANSGVSCTPAKPDGMWCEPKRRWLSGPGSWEWARSKLLTAADQNNDGGTESTVLYDYGNANTGLFLFDPGNGYAPDRKWLSGPGGWEWARSKPV